MTDFARELARAVAGANAPRSGFCRVEVPAPDMAAIDWLIAQPFADKGYWSDRDDSLEVAAAGEADTIKGSSKASRASLFEAVESRLADAPAALRYYGGFRFAADRVVDAGWKPFGAFRFLLPRFEFIQRNGINTLACNFRRNQRDAALSAIEHLKSARSPRADHMPRRLASRDEPDVEGWRSAVAEVLENIRAGKLEKAVLARRTVMDFFGRVDPLLIMARLRREMPGCFNFCGSHRGLVAFAGASPERLYRRDGRALKTEALAGTRPRGATPEADARAADELLASGKERAEHAVVADSICEALRPIAEVECAAEPRILRLPNVQHLHTTITARLAPGASDAEILARLHPTPAVGGWPKARALKLISQLEPFDRGWYSGPVGWVERDAAEFAVAIRCALVLGPRLCLYAGAGIVEGSNADDEWRELDGKALGLMKVLEST